ncbi:MAG: LacI family transcriptional regulator [Acidobacteriia bacterium]|nr:LacI family transcriptional regulator [Terriglobia bacterium]
MKTVNIHDVARIAGVGVGTVSRVLNGGAHVKRSTFVRVSAVIQRLKFRPNAQARRIQRRRSEMVCFILSNRPFLHPVHAAILQGAEACARARNYHVVFVVVHHSESVPPNQIPLPPVLEERGWTDGVILTGAVYPNLVRRIEMLGIPFVAFGNNVFGLKGRRRFDQVCYDGAKGEFEATEYLIGQGHRSIAFVGDISYPWFREQCQGYVGAMRANKLRPILLTSQQNRNSVGYGEAAATSFLKKKSLPTAILAGNDEIAYGLWRSFRRRGVRVPQDVSLIGLDDLEIGLMMEPPLTTIRVLKEEIGRACMVLLHERLHHRHLGWAQRIVQTKLVMRGTVWPR